MIVFPLVKPWMTDAFFFFFLKLCAKYYIQISAAHVLRFYEFTYFGTGII